MFRLMILMFISLLWNGTSEALADQQIVPGVRIGEIRLGDSQARVHNKLGKPVRAFKTHGGRTADLWRAEKFEVVYRAGKVVQIKTYIADFKTTRGVGTASTLATIKRLYPRLKRTTYFFDTENGEGLAYYADIQGGVTFVVPVPWKESEKPEKPWIIIVHPAGQSAIPTEIKDPGNRSSGEPTRSTKFVPSPPVGMGASHTTPRFPPPPITRETRSRQTRKRTGGP